MNKLFTKIATAVVGFAMAIGVGAAVANHDSFMVVRAVDDISISETTTGTSYTSTYFDISAGGAKNSSYYKLGSATFTSKNAYNIDSQKDIKYTIKTRKFGGPSDAQAVVNLNLLNGSTVVGTATYSPTNTTLTDYSGKFTISGDTSSVKFVIAGNGSSGGDKGVAISSISFTATSQSGGGGGGGDEPAEDTGTIVFGNQTGQYSLNGSNLSPTDSLDNTWTATPNWAAGYTASYTNSDGKVQIGAKSSDDDKKWITSISFTLTLSETYTITAFSVKTSGFTETDGTATLKVGTTQVGTGSIGQSVSTTSATDTTQSGTKLTILLEGNPRMRFYLHEISYTIESESADPVLDHLDLSGTYPTVFTVGDEFSHEGMTITAVYDNEDQIDVTSSATFSGYNMSATGNQTVTVTYNDGTTEKTTSYNITVNSAAPSLSLTDDSVSGYKNQEFSVTATYSNLASAFSWGTPSISDIVLYSISSTGSPTTGTSTISGTYNTVGTTVFTISAGGIANPPTLTLETLAITVSLNTNATTIGQGRNKTLTATVNYGSVTWESNKTDIATVSDGTVTVVSNAPIKSQVTITAKSTIDTNVKATCTVTVSEAPVSDVITLSTTGVTSSSYTNWSGKNGSSSPAVYAGQSAKSSNSAVQMRSTNPSGIVSTTSGGLVRSVVVTWNTTDMSTTAKTLDIYCKNTAYISGADLYDNEKNGTKVGSISYTNKTTYSTTLNIEGDYSYIGIRSNSGAIYLDEIDISWELPSHLYGVTVSFANDPADRTFTAGTTFAFNGTLTAHYTGADDATKTPASFHLNGQDGTVITTSTVLTVEDHNGKSVYVVYSEGGYTKSDSFILIVNYSPATSVDLSSYAETVAVGKAFDVTNITATVNPASYVESQSVTWEVYDSGGLIKDDTYIFDGEEFYATEAADVIFHVKANETPSVFAIFTLNIVDTPMVALFDSDLNDVTNGSTSVYGDAGTITYLVTTENFDNPISYTWSSTDSSVISVDNDQGDLCDFYVEGKGGNARLSCRVQGSTKGDVTVYIDVTVVAVTITEVIWNAPTIDVYKGETLSSASGWNVKYHTNSDPTTDKTPDSFKIMLGDNEITLPYTWSVSDDGKDLYVQYGGVNSTSTTVSVTQTLRPINKTETIPGSTYNWEQTNTTNPFSPETTSVTLGSVTWTCSSMTNMSVQGAGTDRYIQFGRSSEPETLVLRTSNIQGTITGITVNCGKGANGTSTIGATVGGQTFITTQTMSYFSQTNVYGTDVSGTGSASGEVVITLTGIGTSGAQYYLHSIEIETADTTSITPIANIDGHEAAQKAVVKFAKAFNTAMSGENVCSGTFENLTTAWANATSAWTTFTTEIAKLGDEEDYAKDLIKWASAQWTQDTDSNYEYCLERAMATYERCVKLHGMTPFMSEVRTVTPSRSISIFNIDNSNMASIIVIISMISIAAVGGYFFLRKRKED